MVWGCVSYTCKLDLIKEKKRMLQYFFPGVCFLFSMLRDEYDTLTHLLVLSNKERLNVERRNTLNIKLNVLTRQQ